jgi:putative flippase GtrA
MNRTSDQPKNHYQMKKLLVTYVLVGILNTIFGYSLFAFFIFLQIHYAAAVLFATVIGVLFNFKTIGGLVFKSHNNALIFRFVAVYVIVYVINVAGLKVFDSYGVDMYLAGFLMLFPATAVSFTLHNWFVFREAS